MAGLGLVAVALAVAGYLLLKPQAAAPPATLISPTTYIGPGSMGVAVGASLWPASAPTNKDTNQYPDTLNAINTLGAHWARGSFDWDDIQSSYNGSYNWARADAYVNPLVAHNINIIAQISSPPAWAMAGSTTDPNTSQDVGCGIYPYTAGPDAGAKALAPFDFQAFAKFAQALAVHYAGKIKVMEVTNEPNHDSHGDPTALWNDPDGCVYANLMIDTYNAVKDPTNGNPGMLVMTAGLAGRNKDDFDYKGGFYSLAATTFITQMYSVAGYPGHSDATVYHAYSFPDLLSSSDRLTDMTFIATTVHAHAKDAGERIWITEYGAPPTGSGMTPQRQADLVCNAVKTLNSYWWGGGFMWFQFHNNADSKTGGSFGLTSDYPDFTPVQPAWNAFHSLAADPSGDVSYDGKVNTTDLGTLKQNYGLAKPSFNQGDLNGDGQVNVADLATMAQHWGSNVPNSCQWPSS